MCLANDVTMHVFVCVQRYNACIDRHTYVYIIVIERALCALFVCSHSVVAVIADFIYFFCVHVIVVGGATPPAARTLLRHVEVHARALSHSHE